MFNSSIDEIKNRLDIVEVIGSYIKLQKAGANYRAICPFHSEKSPSFFVSPARQIWHCFGSCSEGGDIFKFIMKIEGVEFGDALRILAKKAGVELKKQSPESARWQTERKRLYDICELAAKFFEKQLSSTQTGQKVKEYLSKRGISEESMEKWQIGYAPDTWRGLFNFLIDRGYTNEEIEKTSLAIKGEKGGFYDRFRGRIMFPIFDLNSQIVGFTGRVTETQKADTAKYVNTASTMLYDKSKVLYGLDKAKIAVRKQDECILVEGQTDVVMSHQAGIENVVATSGTALTPYQLAILKRYSKNLVTAFDMDVAGDSATKRGIELALAQGFDIKIITMPEGKDPADVVAENPELWSKLVGQVKSILEFYFETSFAKHDSKTAEGKKEIAKILLPIIKRIPNRIEQAHWIQHMSQKLEVKEDDIEEELKKLRSEQDYSAPSAIIDDSDSEKKEMEIGKDKGVKPKKQLLEERIIALILRAPQNISLISQELLPFFSTKIQEIFSHLQKDPDALKKQDFPLSVKDFLNTLSLKAEIEETEIEPKEEIQFCLQELQSLEIKNKLDNLAKEIKRAEAENDAKKLEALMEDFNKMAGKLINIT